MSVTPEASGVRYDSRRNHDAAAAVLSASYRPAGAPFEAVAGSLEYFLTERYCLYNVNHRGAPYRLEIHHPPWSLQPADAEFRCNTMAEAAGVPLPDIKPLLHFSRRQDAVAWAPGAL